LARLLAAAHGGQIAFYEESAGGTVAVITQASGRNRFQRLYIQGVSNSGDALPSLRYMRLQALLPLLIHRGSPRSALVIGYGTGITAGALSRYPGLDRRVVAELLPAVLRAGPYFDGTYGAATDSGLTLRLSDGRRELQRSGDRYDLITLEPPPPSAVSVVNLYSTDFYRLATARLNRDGLVAQWLPLATQNEADTRALIRSFIDVFPYASLWTTELHEMLLIGSDTPFALDLPTIAARMRVPPTADALRDVGIASPAAMIATWVTDRDGLLHFTGDAAAVSDDRPGIEYASWVRPGVLSRILPDLIALRSEPPVQGGDAAFAADLTAERAALDALYGTALDAYAGDRDAWARDIGRAAEAKGDDPYFRWFIGPQD
jgi:spermidine synthase